MITIRDIARMSHHSISTVSRVLNNSGYVAAGTRAEIEAIIAQTGYVPNAVGQELRRGKRQVIGVVMPNNTTPYFTQLLSSVVQVAAAHSTQILLLISDYQPALERQYLETLRRHAVDALIFLSHEISIQEISQFHRYGQIVLAEDPKDTGLPAAYTRQELSQVEALAWVKAKQAPRMLTFFFERSVKESGTSQSWAKAYRKVFKRAVAAKQMITGIKTFGDAYDMMAQIGPEPDFIVANSDEAAAGVLQYQRDHQLPAIGVLGQEAGSIGKVMNIPTIDHHLEELGAHLFEDATSPEAKVTAISATFIPDR